MNGSLLNAIQVQWFWCHKIPLACNVWRYYGCAGSSILMKSCKQINQPLNYFYLLLFIFYLKIKKKKKKKKTKNKNKTKPQKTFSPRGNCFFNFQLSEIKLHRKDYHLLPVISINYLVLETFEEYQHPKNSKCCSESIKYFKRKRTNH